MGRQQSDVRSTVYATPIWAPRDRVSYSQNDSGLRLDLFARRPSSRFDAGHHVHRPRQRRDLRLVAHLQRHLERHLPAGASPPFRSPASSVRSASSRCSRSRNPQQLHGGHTFAFRTSTSDGWSAAYGTPMWVPRGQLSYWAERRWRYPRFLRANPNSPPSRRRRWG